MTAPTDKTCVSCSRPLIVGWEFCAFCGTKVLPASTTAPLDAYLQNQVQLELSRRLKDQSSVVREIADKAEDVVWKRFKIYTILSGVILALIIGFITFLGFNSLDAVSKRIEPVVSAAEQRAQAAKATIEETASKVDAVKSALDELSRDVDAQTKRVTEKGGDISQKLESFDAAARQAEELSARLNAIAKSLETRVEQVSKQVDNLSVQQAYPTLGQEKFVTFNANRWKGRTEKAANEKWININIDPSSLADFSPEQVESLVTALKDLGYTPLVGRFGIGGAFNQGYGNLGNAGDGSTVFYFQQSSEQMAKEVVGVASRIIAAPTLTAKFSDGAMLGANGVFVVENSGLDLQLFLYKVPQK